MLKIKPLDLNKCFIIKIYQKLKFTNHRLFQIFTKNNFYKILNF